MEKYRLLDRASAVRSMHFPKDHEENHQAKRRVVLKSSFISNASSRIEKAEKQKRMVWRSFMMSKIETIYSKATFELTNAQNV